MCEFVSWVEKRGKIYFLTGEQLFQTEKGKEFIKTISPNDYCGHGTIRAYYGIDEGDGINKECVDFSRPSNFPIQIVKAIKAGKFKGFNLPVALLSEPISAKCQADRQLLDDKYWADRKPLDGKYWADLKPLVDKYLADRKPLVDKYWADRKPLMDKYWADRQLLDDKYLADRKPLEDKYWDLFITPENRNPKWK